MLNSPGNLLMDTLSDEILQQTMPFHCSYAFSGSKLQSGSTDSSHTFHEKKIWEIHLVVS